MDEVHALEDPVAFEVGGVGPMGEVIGGEEAGGAGGVLIGFLLDPEEHDPFLGGGVPEDLGVALAGVEALVVDDGPAFVPESEGFSVVGGVGHGLVELGLVGEGVEGDEGLGIAELDAEGIVVIDDGGAGEDGAFSVIDGVGGDGVGVLGPADHVGAGGVAPGHVAPVGAVGVVLEVEVVVLAIVDHAVGVVDPAFLRGEVELGAVRVVVGEGGGRGFCCGFWGRFWLGFGLGVGLGLRFWLRSLSYFGSLFWHGFGGRFGGWGVGLFGDRRGRFFGLLDFWGGGGFGALDDVVDVEVAPFAGGFVDDAELGFLAFEVGDVPGAGVEFFVVDERGGAADDLVVDEELEFEFAGLVATADEEVEVVEFDLKKGREEVAGGFVAMGEGVDEALALEAGDSVLGAVFSGGGCFAEGGAGDEPIAVVLAFEVGDDDVIGREDGESE